MGFVEKRSGRYRARYRDPLGRQRSGTFTRKADAERFPAASSLSSRTHGGLQRPLYDIYLTESNVS